MKVHHKMYDIIIIGGGPAGLTAANNTAHRGLKTLVLETRPVCGGQPYFIFPNKIIKDHPGFPKGISGLELSKRLNLQAESSGAEIRTSEEVLKIKKTGKSISVKTAKQTYQARKVILATGLLSHPKKHKVLEEIENIHVSHNIRNISYRGKELVIVGGGDSAFDNAFQLASVAKKVTVLVKESYAKAKSSTVDSVQDMGEKIIYNSEVIESSFKKGKIEHIRVDVKGKNMLLKPDEVIVCIGYLSAKDFFLSQGLKMNKDGSVKVDKHFETNIPGVFAAGDVTGEIKLIAVACAEGIAAAVHAFEEIQKPYWLH